MKVLLINPPWTLDIKDRDFYRVTQPEGLGYIASSLEASGHKVKLIDAAACGWKNHFLAKDKAHFGMSYSQINKIIARFKPDLIGISIISSLLKANGYTLAQEIKKQFPKTKIVVGGAHPSVATRDCLSKKYIDMVAIGEGETTMIELLSELRNKRPDLSKVMGIAYKHRRQIKINPPREPNIDLDKLPLPARHFYPFDDYFAASNRLLSSFALSTYNKKWATVITSRGCPYHCVFCSIHLSMGRRWRPRSAQSVINEIEILINKYGIQHIIFLDDNMSLNKIRMNQICDQILERGLKFEWSTPNGLRADSLDEKLLQKMKKAGCVRIAVAPESGSQRVVTDIIGKNLNLNEVVRVVKICKRIHLQVDCFFVIGLPGETKKDINLSISFARKLKKMGASGLNFAVATPFLGTRLHQIFSDLGYLKPNFDEFTMFRNNSFIETEHLNSTDIAHYKKLGNKISGFPFAYLKFVLLMSVRDPVRFFRLAKDQIRSLCAA